jgi:hypothetical protein
VGKKEGSQDEGGFVVSAAGGAVSVGEASASSEVSVGFGFVGRSGWSVGTSTWLVAVGTVTDVIVAAAVVVAISTS